MMASFQICRNFRTLWKQRSIMIADIMCEIVHFSWQFQQNIIIHQQKEKEEIIF